MTNEKAIQLLHRLSDEQFDGPHGDERREALEMAVRALEGDSDTIYRQQAIDAHCELCPDKYICCPVRNGNICPDYEVFRLLPSAQPELKRTEYIPETKAVRAKRDCVDLSERVSATFYDQEHEEWTQQTVTIADVLDSVCDDYTVLPSAQPTYTDEEIQRMQDLESAEIEKAYQLGYEEGKKDAQPGRKTGKWIKLDAHAHLADHKCTACGQECYVPTCMGEPMYTYCPNCGARMVKEGEEHD